MRNWATICACNWLCRLTDTAIQNHVYGATYQAGVRAAQQAQENAAMYQAIERFKASHELYENLRPEMAGLISSGAVPAGTTLEMLEAAY
jgi:hypothetical protein